MNLKSTFLVVMIILILSAPVYAFCGGDRDRINSSEETCCEGLDMKMSAVVTAKMNSNCKSPTGSCDALCRNMTQLVESYQRGENTLTIVGLVLLAIFIWVIVVGWILLIKIYGLYGKSNPSFGFLRKYLVAGFLICPALLGISYRDSKEIRLLVIQMRIALVLIIIGFILLGL